MSLRRPAGFIRPGYDPLEVPNAPTIGTATGGDTQASVAFTAPSNVGGAAITAYYAVSNPDQITASGTSSPVTVTGLTNGTSYTFQVWALNSYGPSPYSAASGSVTPVGQLGLFGGGSDASGFNIIDYVTITTTGDATDFGDLLTATNAVVACSSSTRGIWYTSNASISYITFSTTGNAASFGTLSPNVGSAGSCSNSTRGLFGGGFDNDISARTSSIDYITIATTGNSVNFGNLTQSRNSIAATSSPTRGIFAGGFATDYSNVMDYVTIESTGNAIDFGDLISPSYGVSYGICSSGTRGVFAGGITSSGNINVIQYVTIASTGDATDFGDLNTVRRYAASCGSSTRGLFAGGASNSGVVSSIRYITIATTGNTTTFGNLTQAREDFAGCSNAHGGL